MMISHRLPRVARRGARPTPRRARRRTSLQALAFGAITAALAIATPLASRAQSEIRVADVRGDQLLYVYDARPGRVSFLLVSNPSSAPVSVDLSFYPLTLASRLGGETLELAAGGHAVVDPAVAAGGVAAGNAGLAVFTPIAGGGDPTPIVPPEPLTGAFTLANTALASAFGENAFGRLAVTGNGARAAAGSAVTGNPVRYQRIEPGVLAIPLYFDPRTLGPAENDGNRVLLAAFEDRYGVTFEVEPASVDAQASLLGASGSLITRRSISFAGVLLSDLQSVAGSGTALTSSGKVFFDVRDAAANVLGVFSQSLGTFASGHRMAAVDQVPEGGEGPASCSEIDVTATVDWNATEIPDVSSVGVRVDYPSAAVGIPGSSADASIRERVTNLTGITGGLFEATDLPRPGSASDDRIEVALVTLPGPIPPGAFARVRFDCVSGAQAPLPTSFSCAGKIARSDGSPEQPASCALAVEVHP